ncbi:hypothetical protein Micbo1qcDRAFT_151725 [Microdochium bolleyi]|uniref:GS catalytic domain-containing protein n=1 Tax=Microdochium bolleyi TaxID=196109 RepID=A0A136ISF3_9PEZI|nr:hypothetical protein Micbo1qcDRAFT_151725 [Microdochium bolleyi]
MPPHEGLDRLYKAIDKCPIIDNHAHPLLRPEYLNKYPLLSIASEAHGDALAEHPNSLPHLRATRQLASMLGCNDNWAHVEASIQQIRSTDPEAWTRKCLGGIETLLLDDGLDNPEQIYEYSWHDQFTRSKCKRIVRIEALAEFLIKRRYAEHPGTMRDCSLTAWHVEKIIDAFTQAVHGAVQDPEVVGFKSIICYRSGLDISQFCELDTTRVRKALETDLLENTKKRYKLRNPFVNQFFVHLTAQAITDEESPHKKPFQFHTGLGDNDITLTRSSPSHLQEFIRDYPKVPIVLLHSGYPWTREMGYLAAHYANVYADIGEVFPMVSRHGQDAILRQILEVCPWTKILWSTDGHWFPETYVLATVQARSVFKSVIGELVHAGDISQTQAIQLVEDMFFNNSNKLYNLQLQDPTPVDAPFVTEPSATFKKSAADAQRVQVPIIAQLRTLDAKWLRIYWHDYTSSSRCRLVPIKEVYRKLGQDENFSVSITKASLGLLQMDMAAPGVAPTGMYTLQVDWTTLRAGPVKGHASCFGTITEDGTSTPLCPRTSLRNALERAADMGLSFLMGFEIEFVVMKRTTDASNEQEKYQLLPNDGHAWSMSRVLADWGRESSFSSAMDDILEALDLAEINIEMFHPESAPGQYEIVLPALPPMEACDTLLHTRQIVESVAARHGFRVTLHPKPFRQACGSACHMHLSVATRETSKADAQEKYDFFYGGILDHLRAILAITYPNPVSYERMVDSFWAGGRWVTWGTQNKEAPLRKCDGESHWELKVMDGLANPYFAAMAVISAGLDGIRTGTSVKSWGDCSGDPAKLTPQEMAELRISKMLPADLGEALRALEEEQEKSKFLASNEFVERYVRVKKAEIDFMAGMSAEERRTWIIERY